MKTNALKSIYLSSLLLISATSFAQIGVGTTTPNSSTILDVNSTSKGVLLPSVNLTSNTMDLDGNNATTQPIGMLVYNSGSTLTKGFCYWTGTEWRSINHSSLATGTLGSLLCNTATLSPDSYTSGTAYSGTLTISYTGSNGGLYAAQTLSAVNGLTATIVEGNFSLGSGTLTYSITGTPTVTSPTTTTFPITIGGKTCSAVVGVGSGIAPGDLVFYKTSVSASTGGSILLSSLVSDLPILGGKLRLDGILTGSANGGDLTVSFNPVLYNTSSSSVKLWYSAMSTVNNFNASNYLLASGSYVQLDNGIYCNYGYNDILGTSTARTAGIGQSGHNEVLTADVVLDEKWYRVSYFPIIDNKNTSTDSDNTREIYLSIQRLY